MTEHFLDIGKIVNTHGVRGEVRVIRITDFPERFTVGNTVYLIQDNQPPQPLTIKSHRLHKQFDLLQFDGRDTLNDVLAFKGAHLKIKKDQLSELPQGIYYHYQIIDCAVFTQTGEKVGTVTEILSPGANDVWVVKRHKQKDALIPFIKDVVKDIDIPNKKIIIEPMEGLLD